MKAKLACLTVDGAFVGRGPNRSMVENWQYQTYEIGLKPGRHVMEATVWKLGDKGPLAQLSWRGGFVLKASGAYDAKLTTGVAPWQVGHPLRTAVGGFGCPCCWRRSGYDRRERLREQRRLARSCRDRLNMRLGLS